MNKKALGLIDFWNEQSKTLYIEAGEKKLKAISSHRITDNSKIIAGIVSKYNDFRKGRAVNCYRYITNEWLVQSGANNEQIKKIMTGFTHEEIFRIISDYLKQFNANYWPFTVEGKKALTKSLDKVFYNNYNQKCPSPFLKVFIKPPEAIYVENDDQNKEITDIYLNEYVRFDVKTFERNSVIKYVGKIIEFYDTMFDIFSTSDSYYDDQSAIINSFGEDILDFVEKHIEYLNDNVSNRSIRTIFELISFMRIRSKYFDLFLTHCCKFNAEVMAKYLEMLR